MALNLLTFIQEQFTPTVIDQLGTNLNEPSGNVRKAVEGIIPIVLGGLTRHVQEGRADTILELLKDGNYSKESTPLDIAQVTDTRLDTQTAVATGSNFLSQIFKDDTDQIASHVAMFSGIKVPSALSLMGLVGSAIMGLLGRQYQNNGLSSFNLESLLGGQAASFRSALPEGLASVAGLLGFDEFAKTTGPQTEVQGIDFFENTPLNPNIPKSPEGERQHENRRWLRWIWVVLGILVIGLIVQKCREPQDSIEGIYTDTTRRAEPDAVEDTSATTKQHVEESHGQVGDSTAPGALGIRDSTRVVPK